MLSDMHIYMELKLLVTCKSSNHFTHYFFFLFFKVDVECNDCHISKSRKFDPINVIVAFVIFFY